MYIYIYIYMYTYIYIYVYIQYVNVCGCVWAHFLCLSINMCECVWIHFLFFLRIHVNVCDARVLCLSLNECVQICVLSLSLYDRDREKTYIHLPAKDARNRILAVHELVDSRFLVLAGSESIFTEITGYKYFSLI